MECHEFMYLSKGTVLRAGFTTVKISGMMSLPFVDCEHNFYAFSCLSYGIIYTLYYNACILT